MISTQLTHHLSLEVSCPACPETYAVPLDAVEQSQCHLDEHGPCSGMAIHECPTPYLASLAPREAIAHLHEAVRAFEEEVRGGGAHAVWADDQPGAPEAGARLGGLVKALLASTGAAGPAARMAAPARPPSEVEAVAAELTRWDDDGGAPRGPEPS